MNKLSYFTLCFEVYKPYIKIDNNEKQMFIDFKVYTLQAPHKLAAYKQAADLLTRELYNYRRGCSFKLISCIKRKFQTL